MKIEQVSVLDINKTLKAESRVSTIRTKQSRFIQDMLEKNFDAKGLLDPAKLADAIVNWNNKDVSHITVGSGSIVNAWNTDKQLFVKIQRDLKERSLSMVGGQPYGMNKAEKIALTTALDTFANDYLPRVIAQCEQRLELVGVAKVDKAVKELETA